MMSIGAIKGFSVVSHNAYQRPAISKPGFKVSNAIRVGSDDKWAAQNGAVSRPPLQKRQWSHSTKTDKVVSSRNGRSVNKLLDPSLNTDEFNRNSFAEDFVFGTASAAYQYEGGAFEIGKGPSIWDTYSSVYPANITDRSNGDVANDSYNRYKEDVQLLKELGVDTYRFSISWSRLIPYGKINRGVNEKGIQYYHNLIDELLANGITPCVTLFHFDLPQYLQDAYGGFYSSEIVKDFVDFADLCFSEYGGKVKEWITFNEPYTFCTMWYQVAIDAAKKCQYSGECTDGDPAATNYMVAHNMILAHGAAVQLYRNSYEPHQEGTIGITLNSIWFEPYSATYSDEAAKNRALDFTFGWFMHPVTYGEYPTVMQTLVGSRLPQFTEEQSKMLKGSYDFLGFNYYTARFAKDAPAPIEPGYDYDGLFTQEIVNSKGQPIGPLAAPEWMYLYPEGLYKHLVYIKDKYNDPLIYITENGVGDEEYGHVFDLTRVKFYQDHLKAVHDAININNVNVKGFYAWSLMDNYEWKNGYTAQFGIYRVDYDDGRKRYPKESALWYRDFLNPATVPVPTQLSNKKAQVARPALSLAK